VSTGIEETELEWFGENACPPDVLGVNHYLTSERFLDERLGRYPASTHGGNGRQRYADVEAVRVCAEGTAGPRALLREAWERYRLPLAVTEVHLGCTRDEQLRWLKEVWEAARSLRDDGADVRAVTAWSLLGAYDWHNLLTSATGHYEPGVFDLRSPAPRPTALARMLRDLAGSREHEHPVLAAPGWWHRLTRLTYPPVRRSPRAASSTHQGINMSLGTSRPILITGASGTLGRAFARLCDVRGLSYQLLTRRQMDIAEAASVEAALDELEPWAVVNAAGYVRVDDAEREPESCRRENTDGPQLLATHCARRAIKLITFSSDLVFDGRKRTPYVESDAMSPLGIYGQSKAEMETRVLAAHPSALVIRTSAFFGPWDDYNFVTVALRTLAAGQTFTAASDAVVSPTYVPDLVHACLDLLIDGESGLWHLANAGAMSWAELAHHAARLAGLDANSVEARATASLQLIAPRPAYAVLGSERGLLLPTLEEALSRYLRDCDLKWTELATADKQEKELEKAASARF
jgi:dTDP-4-dehydrorhamnose reductase